MGLRKFVSYFALATATLLGISNFGLAEESVKPKPPSQFVSLQNGILIKPYIESPGLNLELATSENQDHSVIWAANYRLNYGLSLSYQDLFSFSLSVKGELSAEDANLKGKSEYTDFRFRFPSRAISIDLGYQKLKGFFAENTNSFSSGPDAYLLRPDLSLQSIYAGMIVAVSPDRYSLAAAYNQSERQTVSGGSWLVSGHISNTTFQDKSGSPLIPVELQPYYPSEAHITKGDFYSATVGGGYGYLWAFGTNGYAIAQGVVDLGLQLGYASDPTKRYSNADMATHGKVDLGVGLNGTTQLLGLLISYDATTYRTTETELSKANIMVHAFYGIRL